MINQSEWVWYGQPQHFCASKDCHWHLATKVGRVLISSVGRYFPNGNMDGTDGEDLSPGGRMHFETMVFEVTGACMCGHDCDFVSLNFNDLDCMRYHTAEEARRGHLETCLRWARKEYNE